MLSKAVAVHNSNQSGGILNDSSVRYATAAFIGSNELTHARFEPSAALPYRACGAEIIMTNSN